MLVGTWELTLWDVNTGEKIHTIKKLPILPIRIEFSSDGHAVLIGGADNLARILDVESDQELQHFEGHSDQVTAETFSPSGTELLTGSWDNTARLWDIKPGHELKRFVGHSRFVTSVAFVSNKQKILTSSNDGTTRLWELSTQRLSTSLISYTNGDWTAVNSPGHFDTSDFDGSLPLHWSVNDDPSRPLPLDIFMRDYYEPRLLPHLFACHDAEALGGDPEACKKAFKPVRALAALNRIQPDVRIVGVQRGAWLMTLWSRSRWPARKTQPRRTARPRPRPMIYGCSGTGRSWGSGPSLVAGSAGSRTSGYGRTTAWCLWPTARPRQRTCSR